MNRFGKQAFNVAACILNGVKGALNAFPNVPEQGIEFGRVLTGLVGAFGGPEAVAGVEQDLGLPIVADETLVAKDVAIPDLLGEHLSGLSFIQVSRDQVVQHGQAVQRGQHDQFVAEIAQFAGRTVAIACSPSKRAVLLAAFIAQHWNGFGVQQQLFRVAHPQSQQPSLPQSLNPEAQGARTPLKLALVQQFWKQRQVISPHEAHKLRLAWIRNKVLRQHQGHRLAIAEFRLGSWLACQQVLLFSLIPIIHQHVNRRQQVAYGYTRHRRVFLQMSVSLLPSWITLLFWSTAFHITRTSNLPCSFIRPLTSIRSTISAYLQSSTN